MDKRLGRVSIWGRRSTIGRDLRECLPGNAPMSVHDADHDWPQRADYYIVRSLSSEVEREAARLGAMCVCLPAAKDWLVAKLKERTGKGETVWICQRRKG